MPLLRDIANLVPQSVYPLFKSLIMPQWKGINECITSSPDTNVRTALSQLLLHFLNVIIQIHVLQLNCDTDTMVSDEHMMCEKDIYMFLVGMLRALNTDVARNWVRMSAYLELIRDFVMSGEA